MIQFKHGNIDLKLEKPAFLVGNGINYADGCSMSWEELLMDISGKQTGFKKLPASLSYPEIAELALLRKSPEEFDKKSKNEFLSMVTEKIKTDIEKASRFNDNHEKLAVFAQEHKIPILTTNFDRNFLRTSCFEGQDLDKIDLNWIKLNPAIEDNDYQILRNAYFRPKSLNKNPNIHSEFAIWHIHGVIGKSSYKICFTNWDYFNYCAKIKEISKNHAPKDQSKDATWIDIFLDNDLIIMGLGLDSFETDLRALLSERNIKHKLTKKLDSKWEKPATIYIYRKEAAESEMPADKKALFEALGIRCVPMAQGKIYEIDKYLK